MQRTRSNDLDALWSRWSADRDPGDRDALVDAYTRFVRILAAKCYAKRIGHGLEYGDYLQFGMVGLLESIDRFDSGMNVKFETFAGYRIQGAILNGVESLTEVQKQVTVRGRMLRERSSSLSGNSDDEPALERLARIAIGLAIGFALEDSGIYAEEDDPAVPDNAYSRVELIQLKRHLADLVNSLPQQQRTVIHRHYFQQVPFEEIASAMKLTKGRISQIHRAALASLAELQQREQLKISA
jgi:RNA polymerase sigma factor for flagellar operon FliA